MEVLIGKSPINGTFSIDMFDYRRLCGNIEETQKHPWRMDVSNVGKIMEHEPPMTGNGKHIPY